MEEKDYYLSNIKEAFDSKGGKECFRQTFVTVPDDMNLKMLIDFLADYMENYDVKREEYGYSLLLPWEGSPYFIVLSSRDKLNGLTNCEQLIERAAKYDIHFAVQLNKEAYFPSFLDFVNNKLYRIVDKGTGYGSVDDADSFDLYGCVVSDYIE